MLALALLPAIALGGWGAPRTVAPPRALDLAAPQVAGGPGGAVAIGFGRSNADDDAGAQALLVTGQVGGRFGGVRDIAGARGVLAASYVGSRLVVLTGLAPAGRSCCTSVSAVWTGRSSLRAGRPLVAGLSGPVEATLVPDGPRLLAVVTDEQGVWAALSGPRGERFAGVHRLSGPRQLVQSVAAVPGPAGGATIAWTARSDSPTAFGPTAVLAAHAAPGRPPGAAHPVLRAPAGHSIDELALASGAVPTLAWVESDVSAAGRFHSVVKLARLVAGRLRARPVSGPAVVAGGLAAGGRAGGGPVVLSWRACGGSGSCSAQAVVASAGGVLGRVRALGGIEAEEQPAVAVTGAGVPLVSWVDGAGVQAVSAAGTRFSVPRKLTRSRYAAGVTLAAAGTASVVAVWVEGTAREQVRAASWAPR